MEESKSITKRPSDEISPLPTEPKKKRTRTRKKSQSTDGKVQENGNVLGVVPAESGTVENGDQLRERENDIKEVFKEITLDEVYNGLLHDAERVSPPLSTADKNGPDANKRRRGLRGRTKSMNQKENKSDSGNVSEADKTTGVPRVGVGVIVLNKEEQVLIGKRKSPHGQGTFSSISI